MNWILYSFLCVTNVVSIHRENNGLKIDRIVQLIHGDMMTGYYFFKTNSNDNSTLWYECVMLVITAEELRPEPLGEGLKKAEDGTISQISCLTRLSSTMEVNLRNSKTYRFIDFLTFLKKRRNRHPILGTPRHPEDLPRAERIIPGHTLIRPAKSMLESAVKYPQNSKGSAVYGNLDNLGITYDKTHYRGLYSNFRRNNDEAENLLLQALKNINKSNGNKKNSPVIVFEIDPSDLSSYYIGQNPNELNSDFRRRKKKSTSHRDRKKKYSLSSSSSSSGENSDSSDDSDFDKNPGNPYTMHKNKYKQNWLWNHFMDGDHMNVNPHGPQFNSVGPSGVDLFFGRKWWYFNQDDYKPMG